MPHSSALTLDVSPKVGARLRQTGTAGLADTLAAMTGRNVRLEALPSGQQSHTQGMLVNDSTAAIDPTLPNKLFTAAVLHEFGHLLGRGGRVPFLAETHGSGAPTEEAENSARAFERAMLALRETAADTTHAEDVIEAIAEGRALSRRGPTPLPRDSRRESGTFRAVLQLLGLPIFEGHPLRSRMSQLAKRFGLAP